MLHSHSTVRAKDSLFSEPKFSWPSHSWLRGHNGVVGGPRGAHYIRYRGIVFFTVKGHSINCTGPVSEWLNDLNSVSYHDLPHQVALSNHLTTRWPYPSNLGPSLCPSQGWTSLVLQSASFMWEFMIKPIFDIASFPPPNSHLRWEPVVRGVHLVPTGMSGGTRPLCAR